MADYFYSREARLDLLEIWEYIARDNLDEADRVEQEIQQAVSMCSLAIRTWATCGGI
jgi:plasmid stabilization system protein ParE